jgi:hypothetical protein
MNWRVNMNSFAISSVTAVDMQIIGGKCLILILVTDSLFQFYYLF